MGHFYDSAGNPCYTYKNAKGEEKDTTLREAKKFGWWPSVTTILQVKASPGLDVYRQNQLLDAAWNLSFAEMDGGGLFSGNEFFGYPEDFKRAVLKQSKEHAKKAADKGTLIHDAIEKYFIKGTYDTETGDIVEPVIKFLDDEFPGVAWVAEKSFTSPLGFGGKVDLHCPNAKIVVDFKTKDLDNLDKVKSYENNTMQSAAYAVGLNNYDKFECIFKEKSDKAEVAVYNFSKPKDWKRYNLYISTSTPGILKLDEHKDFDKDWGMFKALLDYWQLCTGHKP